MSTARSARFTQRDVARALKGAAAAGIKAAVEIAPDGTLRLIPMEGEAVAVRPIAAMIEGGRW